MKKRRRLPLLLLFSLLFTSCASLVDQLGFDTYDYMSEPVIRTHSAGGEVAKELEDFLSILILDSEDLPTFERTGDAIREYRDAVLTFMLKSGYSKYSGNTALIARAEREYPQYSITQIIPEDEFEATMYQYFGGDVKITHRDGDRFTYLSKVNAYVSPMMPEESGLTATITKLEETERTYRIRFRVVDPNGTSSDLYFALVIKREDGTRYIKKLLLASEVGE